MSNLNFLVPEQIRVKKKGEKKEDKKKDVLDDKPLVLVDITVAKEEKKELEKLREDVKLENDCVKPTNEEIITKLDKHFKPSSGITGDESDPVPHNEETKIEPKFVAKVIEPLEIHGDTPAQDDEIVEKLKSMFTILSRKFSFAH